MTKIAADLGAVQETLLVPLWARAAEHESRTSILSDPKAAEIVRSLDYDFSRFSSGALRSRIGIALRTLQFDDWLRAFLAEHPAGTVVDVGCGLNTRFERCDNGTARWLEVDLPDTMAVRRRFFEESDRRRMLPGSVLEDAWLHAAADLPGPYFFVLEGLLMYFEEPEVRGVLDRLGTRFPGERLAVDRADPRRRRDPERPRHAQAKFEARFTWGIAAPPRPGRGGLAAGDGVPGRRHAQGDRGPQRAPHALAAQTRRPRDEHLQAQGGEGLLVGPVQGGVKGGVSRRGRSRSAACRRAPGR